jgi:hypothetical protein
VVRKDIDVILTFKKIAMTYFAVYCMIYLGECPCVV